MIDRLIKYKVTFIILAINLMVYGLVLVSGDSTTDPIAILSWGANFVPYTFDTEWWRLVSSMFLHYGIIHLIANMYTLYILGSSVEEHIGSLPFLIIYFVTGFFAGLSSSYFNLFTISVGASGALFGLYGFETVQVILVYWDDKIKVLKVLLNMVIYVLVISLLGTQFHFDNVAHFGGLIAGFILGLAEVGFKKESKFNRYVSTSFLSVFLILLSYNLMPRFQVEYFKFFQNFIQIERESNNKYNGSFGSDNLYVKALQEVLPKWDTIRNKIEILNLPIALEHDRNSIVRHISLNKKRLEYMITGINNESYIYHDSLEVVSKGFKIVEPLNFRLSISENIDEEKDPEEKEEDSPGKFTKQYYDKDWKEITFPFGANFYRLGFKDSLDRWNGAVQDHYISGGIQMKGVYKDGLKNGIFLYYNEDSTYSASGRYVDERRVGKWQNFHDNGKLSSEVRYNNRFLTINTWDENGNPMVIDGNGEDIVKYANGVIYSYSNYKDGLMDGESYGYYENGKPYYKEFYDNGTLQKGIAYSKDRGKHEYDYATYIPYPQGGFEKFYSYVNRNKKLPLLAITNEVSGEVEMLFTVEEDGNITDIKFTKSIGYGCEDEAKRLLLNGPEWVAGKDHGIEPFASQTSVKISFP